MANLLVVQAHPLTADKSRSVAAQEAFITAYKNINPTDTVTVLDIYKEEVPEIDEFLLSTWADAAAQNELSPKQVASLTRFNELTEQFLSADKIVITNPLWNLSIPGRLKLWIDTIVVKGKTFTYSETGPVGLVPEKKLLHIQSNGGAFAGEEPGSKYLETIFNFMGITDIQHIFVEGVDHQPERAEEIIQEAHDKAAHLAETF
ncbi:MULTISPECIES: FMN-dependent NADH-azoreductase [Vagococcus]|uniref:FMN-dependent NADH-azoreductase n=1 Tax=Vagococcus TaxID=2737 RepID=UPI002FC9D143